jgi:TRAP-type mannitol/chloroaromatic compound transport system permease large subunit
MGPFHQIPLRPMPGSSIPNFYPMYTRGGSLGGIFDSIGTAFGEMLGGAAATVLAIGTGLALGYWGAKLTTKR